MERLRSAPKLKASEAAINAAEGKREAAEAKHYPQLAVASNNFMIDKDIDVDLSGVRDAVGRIDPAAAARIKDVTLQDRNFGSLDAVLKYPLYTGGRISAGVEVADSAIEASRQAREHTYEELLLELVQRYYGVRLAEEALAVQQAAASGLRQHQSNAGKLEQEGQIANVERLSAEVAAAEADREASVAERNLIMARQALASLLDGQDMPPPQVEIPNIASLPPLRRFISGTQGNNAQLKQLAATRKQAESAVGAVKGAYLPAVNLLAVRSMANYNLVDVWPEWTVAATISLPLFDGGERRGKLHQANARLEQVGQTYEQARRDMDLLVEQRYHELENAQEQIRTLRRTRELSDESLRAQQKAFSEGMARSLDVVDAQNMRSKVLLADLGARYTALTNYAALMLVSGQGPALEDWLRKTQESRP
ncbi:TolC family protein [Pseudomonas sp. UL073]|uniref:TolC family protein n=1 Tax=Zestomonas insulae TaxID=2809017 RepID=A0ABS2II12_9GAMM|nr:TolC family protein [Pseudomonas insulae]MBM7061964.1 TolC family protein [Pseudomonas insulae]